ncbi:DnaJ subfamily A member 3, mitochondrial [Balamuthia mandrillaris]
MWGRRSSLLVQQQQRWWWHPFQPKTTASARKVHLLLGRKGEGRSVNHHNLARCSFALPSLVSAPSSFLSSSSFVGIAPYTATLFSARGYATDWYSKDLYGILGVRKNATQQEIKSAFYQKAKQYHPDLNKGDPSAQKKFVEVTNAYEILRDESKRRTYNEIREGRTRTSYSPPSSSSSQRSSSYGPFYYYEYEDQSPSWDYSDYQRQRQQYQRYQQYQQRQQREREREEREREQQRDQEVDDFFRWYSQNYSFIFRELEKEMENITRRARQQGTYRGKIEGTNGWEVYDTPFGRVYHKSTQTVWRSRRRSPFSSDQQSDLNYSSHPLLQMLSKFFEATLNATRVAKEVHGNVGGPGAGITSGSGPAAFLREMFRWGQMLLQQQQARRREEERERENKAKGWTPHAESLEEETFPSFFLLSEVPVAVRVRFGAGNITDGHSFDVIGEDGYHGRLMESATNVLRYSNPDGNLLLKAHRTYYDENERQQSSSTSASCSEVITFTDSKDNILGELRQETSFLSALRFLDRFYTTFIFRDRNGMEKVLAKKFNFFGMRVQFKYFNTDLKEIARVDLPWRVLRWKYEWRVDCNDRNKDSSIHPLYYTILPAFHSSDAKGGLLHRMLG